jgi:phage shock protein A
MSKPTGDAEIALTRLVATMTDGLIQAKNRVVAAKAEAARLARQIELLAQNAEDWNRRAMAAVRTGDDIVAKEALVQKREHQRKADEFRVLFQQRKREVERLTAILAELNFRVEEAKERKSALLRKAERARAGSAVSAALRDASGLDPLDVLGRLERTVDELEAAAGSSPELDDAALSAKAADAAGAAAQLVSMKPLAKTLAAPREPARPARSARSGERRTKR